MMATASYPSSSSTFAMPPPAQGMMMGGFPGIGVPAAASSSSSSCYSHSVSRSDELLACARTAVKIAKRQHQQQPHPVSSTSSGRAEWWNIELSDLRLYDMQSANSGVQQYQQHQQLSSTNEVLEDGLALLRTMEKELQHLEKLVRRRGHTNDPTDEITASVHRLETDTRELMALVQTLVPSSMRAGTQRHKHWQLLQTWFQTIAQQQGVRLKEILKVRGTVLAEQAQRRKLFQASSSPTAPSSGNASSLRPSSASKGKFNPATATAKSASSSTYDNPLFTMQAPPPSAPSTVATATMYSSTNTGTSSSSSTAPASAPLYGNGSTNGVGGTSTAYSRGGGGGGGGPYNYYVGGSGGATSGGYATTAAAAAATGGYGGGSTGTVYYGASAGGFANTGMRQRRAVASAATRQDAQREQQQTSEFWLQEQIQQRQTRQRLAEARQAERSLADLGTLFTKMSSLIVQQGEMVEKIEDDVDSALLDVEAGHTEIKTLYTIKKGNRGLILKTFGLLIFFIIFMRFYRN